MLSVRPPAKPRATTTDNSSAKTLAESGGIFVGAEVTYRGVRVGRVSDLTLTSDGVRAHAQLDRGTEVPRDTLAVVENRSAVGEQFGLIGCAVIIAIFWELAALNFSTTFHAAFTRAEEVGFLGAWHIGQKWPFSKDDVFLSIETSRPVNGAVMGGGPCVRVGDRLSIFDNEGTAVIMTTAKEQGIRVQRCLLDAGACEATATQAAGVRSAGISIPLGNYHNLNDARQIVPEYVMMDDLKSLIDLLKALVATKHDGIGERTIRERVELRMMEHEAHLKAGTKLFK